MHRPHLISSPLVGLLAAVLLSPTTPACRKAAASRVINWQQAMLDTVNAWRTQGCRCGGATMPPVPPVQWNDTLALAAQAHATDMMVNDYFNHIAPDGSSPIQRALQAGYAGSYVGENIAEGYTSLDSVMQAWKNSPDHCTNIMDSTWTTFGAARAGNYWDQEFGGY